MLPTAIGRPCVSCGVELHTSDANVRRSRRLAEWVVVTAMICGKCDESQIDADGLTAARAVFFLSVYTIYIDLAAIYSDSNIFWRQPIWRQRNRGQWIIRPLTLFFSVVSKTTAAFQGRACLLRIKIHHSICSLALKRAPAGIVLCCKIHLLHYTGYINCCAFFFFIVFKCARFYDILCARYDMRTDIAVRFAHPNSNTTARQRDTISGKHFTAIQIDAKLSRAHVFTLILCK